MMVLFYKKALNWSEQENGEDEQKKTSWYSYTVKNNKVIFFNFEEEGNYYYLFVDRGSDRLGGLE